MIAARPGDPDDSPVDAEVAPVDRLWQWQLAAIVLTDSLDGVQLSAQAFAHENFTASHYRNAKRNPSWIQSADSSRPAAIGVGISRRIKGAAVSIVRQAKKEKYVIKVLH